MSESTQGLAAWITSEYEANRRQRPKKERKKEPNRSKVGTRAWATKYLDDHAFDSFPGGQEDPVIQICLDIIGELGDGGHGGRRKSGITRNKQLMALLAERNK